MITLSVGKYVRKENVMIERPPVKLADNNWLVHLSMSDMEANEMEEIYKTKPTALNLLCSRIWYTIIKKERRNHRISPYQDRMLHSKESQKETTEYRDKQSKTQSYTEMEATQKKSTRNWKA